MVPYAYDCFVELPSRLADLVADLFQIPLGIDVLNEGRYLDHAPQHCCVPLSDDDHHAIAGPKWVHDVREDVQITRVPVRGQAGSGVVLFCIADTVDVHIPRRVRSKGLRRIEVAQQV